MFRILVLLQLAVIAICLLPVAAVVWSSWFAERHGCVLNEAGAHPCIVDGTDWGDTLATAFVSGWFGLITLPVAALVAITLAVTLVIRLMRRRR